MTDRLELLARIIQRAPTSRDADSAFSTINRIIPRGTPCGKAKVERIVGLFLRQWSLQKLVQAETVGRVGLDQMYLDRSWVCLGVGLSNSHNDSMGHQSCAVCDTFLAHADILQRWLPLLMNTLHEADVSDDIRRSYTNVILMFLCHTVKKKSPLQTLLVNNPRLLNVLLCIWKDITSNKLLFPQDLYESTIRACADLVVTYLDVFALKPREVWEDCIPNPVESVSLTAIEFLDETLLHLHEDGVLVYHSITIIFHLLNRKDLQERHAPIIRCIAEKITQVLWRIVERPPSALTTINPVRDTRPTYLAILSSCITCFCQLVNCYFDGVTWVLRLIRECVLQALLGADAWLCFSGDREHEHLSEFLTQILPQYLTYRSVLETIHEELKSITQAGLDENIKNTCLKRSWMRFKAIVEEQYTILDEVSEESVCLYERCMGPGCGSAWIKGVTDKTFKRCGGCKTTAYCSTECQKKHWVNHRESCRFEQSLFYQNTLSDVSRRDIKHFKKLAQYHLLELSRMPEHYDAFTRSKNMAYVTMDLDFTKTPFHFNTTIATGGRGLGVNITISRGDRKRTSTYSALAEEITPLLFL